MAEKTEVLVIGGGAVGLCCAYYLQRAGRQVTLLEQGEIGAGCSLGNAGLVVPSHIIPLAAPGVIAHGLKWLLNPRSPFYIRPRLSPAFLAWLWRFRRACSPEVMHRSIPILHALLQASAALYNELEGIGVGVEHRGLLQLFLTERAFSQERHAVDIAHEHGVEIRTLSPAQVAEMDPALETTARGALYYPSDAHLDPRQLTNQLHLALTRAAVPIFTHAAVTAIGVEVGGRYKVHTHRGEFISETLVLAAGAHTPLLAHHLDLRLPVEAGKGYSITIPPGDFRPRFPMLLAEPRLALTPMNSRLRIAGTLELSGLDLRVNRRRVAAMLAALPIFFPRFAPLSVAPQEAWAGLRPCTPDGLPFIGRFQRHPGVIAATGHAMLGISLAPITGKLVAELVNGQASAVDAGRLSPDRFH